MDKVIYCCIRFVDVSEEMQNNIDGDMCYSGYKRNFQDSYDKTLDCLKRAHRNC